VKRATSVIPIVLAVSVDPVGSGLVQSFSHPGGNVTGLSNQGSDLALKRLELLHDAVVPLRRLAIVANAGNLPSMRELKDVATRAHELDINVARLEIHSAEDITPAIKGLTPRPDALYSASDALLIANLQRILAPALDMRLPTMFNNKDYVGAGALLSYGPSYPDLFRRAAELVDTILRGAKAGDIPVEQPTKFELAVNLKTAKAIGLKVRESLVTLAGEVIE
jgi:putative ABC transport system substrate-binding protein